MISYIFRRLLLLPFTLFCIVLVNFFIINLAPGEPTSVTEISDEGNVTRSEEQSVPSIADDQYLQFREYYGLTLPIFLNTWPSIDFDELLRNLHKLSSRKNSEGDEKEMDAKEYNSLRIRFGDQAQYTLPHLLAIANNIQEDIAVRRLAVRYFVRGGTRQGYVGSQLSSEQKLENRKIAKDNQLLREFLLIPNDSSTLTSEKVGLLNRWYEENAESRHFDPDSAQTWKILFFETRFLRYLTRVLTLDFGSLRNDPNKTVLHEVTKRFKYSLTLAVLPMLITFILCQVIGFYMALKQNKFQDIFLNIIALVLYATPVFVVAPFLIEKVALHNTFPFTDISIPYSGFTSDEGVYNNLSSWQRLWDVAQHIALPLIAIIYGSLAAQTRLSRTAVLEVLRQDYVRTARAKGLHPFHVLVKHVGRNASITIVTSIAGSLGVILGGSLIIETIFEINGFGRFFYEAIINRDYNVIMFSALASAFLTLIGYLIADIAYTMLDPRLTLD
ncbi:MAG: peptide/nickel transport system permease protein [Chlamydiales bacterium]|jgi:peptide/nickel transport system permease protein